MTTERSPDSGSKQGDGDWPIPAFYFSVSIGNYSEDISFQEVSGIESQIETEEYQEGGNNIVYYLPKSIKHSNLILKRAIASKSSSLISWCNLLLSAQLGTSITTSTINISLLNSEGQPLQTWKFYNAYPVKFKIEPFNSTKNEVAIEEIEFCYSRIERS